MATLHPPPVPKAKAHPRPTLDSSLNLTLFTTVYVTDSGSHALGDTIDLLGNRPDEIKIHGKVVYFNIVVRFSCYLLMLEVFYIIT